MEWKIFLENYKVSDSGEVVKFKRYDPNTKKYYELKNPKYLKKEILRGYERVNLCLNKKQKHYSVHRLVALLFIPNPNNYDIVNHKNGIKADNRKENLEWCSASYNSWHAYNILNIPKILGDKRWNIKVTDKQVEEIIELSKKGLSQRKIAKIYGLSQSGVEGILNGRKRFYARKIMGM